MSQVSQRPKGGTVGQVGQVGQKGGIMNKYNYQALVQYIVNQGINLAESFEDWTKMAFSLSTLGEEGRSLFHAISSLSEKYNQRESDRKFDDALRSNSRTDISTLVWMAQRAGVDTNLFYTEERVSVQCATNVKKKEIRQICTIPFRYVEESASTNSDFIYFLCGLFDKDVLESPTIENLIQQYAIGATKDGNVIFWQIDAHGKVRTGKVMRYNKETGHRTKEAGAVQWIHTTMKKKGLLPAEWELTQCLFGEHLIAMHPDRLICLTESEKSAIIAAGVYPQYNWLATGGKSNMSMEKLAMLRGKQVIMFPDIDAYDYWKEKAEEMRKAGINVVVSDLLEKSASDTDRANKIDLADLLIQQLEAAQVIRKELSRAERILAEFKKKNPAIMDLITAFDCQLLEAE